MRHGTFLTPVDKVRVQRENGEATTEVAVLYGDRWVVGHTVWDAVERRPDLPGAAR